MRNVPVAPVVRWVLDLLREGTPADWGDAHAPDSAHEVTDPYPYGVLHVVSSTRWGAPLSDPDRELILHVQLDCVGRRPDQARELQDRARGALIDVDLVGEYLNPGPEQRDDWTVVRREHEAGPTPIDDAGEPPDRVFTTSERFTIHATTKEHRS